VASSVRTMSGGPDLADYLRWVGLGCELTGLGITAAGITDLRRRYSNRPGIVATSRAAAGRAGAWLLAAATACARVLAAAGRWVRRTTRDWWRQLLKRRSPPPRPSTGRSARRPGCPRSWRGRGPTSRTPGTPCPLVYRSSRLPDQFGEASREAGQDEATSKATSIGASETWGAFGLRAEAVGVAILALGRRPRGSGELAGARPRRLRVPGSGDRYRYAWPKSQLRPAHPRQRSGDSPLGLSGRWYASNLRLDAEAVAAELNQRDRQPEYGQLGYDDWVVVED
jgi:hypothetical protein